MTLNANILTDTFKRLKQENGGSTAFGLRFYARLFEKYPAVRPLFTTPPEEQHKKLLASIAAIVTSVGNTDVLLPYLHAMAIRHLKYKTENSHYAAVGENLIAVFAEHLSQEGEWTEEMENTWKEAYKIVSSVMIEAASNPEKFEAEIVAKGYKADGFKNNNAEPWVLNAA